MRIGTRLTGLLAIPLLLLAAVLVAQAITQFQERGALDSLAHDVDEVINTTALISALQQERASAVDSLLRAPALRHGQTPIAIDSLLGDAVDGRRPLVVDPAAIVVEVAAARASTQSVVAGLDGLRPDLDYTTIIDGLHVDFDLFIGAVNAPATKNDLTAANAALRAVEASMRQDLEARVMLALAPTAAASERPRAEQGRDQRSSRALDTVNLARRKLSRWIDSERAALQSITTADDRAMAPIAAAYRDPAWNRSIALRNELVESDVHAAAGMDSADWSAAMSTRIDRLQEIASAQIQSMSSTVSVAVANSTRDLLLALALLAAALGISMLAVALVRASVTAPLAALVDATTGLHRGELRRDSRRRDDDALDPTDEIGDVEDALARFNAMVDDLMNEVGDVRQSLLDGTLDRRVDESRFSGVWGDLSSLVNETLDTILQGRLREATANELLAFTRTHDDATGLLNQTGFTEAVDTSALRDCHVLVVAPHGIPALQQTLGHTTLSAVLTSFGRRLEGIDGVLATGRVTHGQFAVATTTDPAVISQRIRSAFSRPVSGGGAMSVIDTSCGYCSDLEESVATRVERASAAVATAMELRSNIPVEYQPAMRERAVRRAAVTAWLKAQVEQRTLDVWFQPIVDATGSIVAFEALARGSMDGAPIQPSEFIPIAEEEGLIGELGDVVLETSIRSWHELGGNRRVSINVSPLQLNSSDIVDRVASLLETYQVPAERIALEITEGAVVESSASIAEILIGLRGIGVHLAIDDFGTGYSSLSYITRLPVSIIKLDRSLITETDNPAGLAVVRHTIDLAHDLGLDIIAEGVETDAQATILWSLGADYIQGFRYAHPAPLRELSVKHRAAR